MERKLKEFPSQVTSFFSPFRDFFVFNFFFKFHLAGDKGEMGLLYLSLWKITLELL